MRLHQRQLGHVFSKLFKTNTVIFICGGLGMREGGREGEGKRERKRDRERDREREGGREREREGEREIKGCRERVEMEKEEA